MARKIGILLVIIGAALAVYFTVRPYVYVNRLKEQEFFAHDKAMIDEKIEASDIKDYFSLGVLYAKKQDFQNAKRYFIETVRLNPRHAGAFNNLGNIAFYEGDAGMARALFHKAVRIEPENAEYLINFASACFKVNLMEEANELVEKALKIDPENSRALYLMAQMRQ